MSKKNLFGNYNFGISALAAKHITPHIHFGPTFGKLSPNSPNLTPSNIVRYTVKPGSQYCRTAHSFRVAVAYHTARIEPSSILALNARHDATAVRLLGTRTRLYRCAMTTKKLCHAVVWQYFELGLIHHSLRTHTCCCIYKLMFIY